MNVSCGKCSTCQFLNDGDPQVCLYLRIVIDEEMVKTFGCSEWKGYS